MGKDKNGKELPRGIRQRKDGLYEGRTRVNGEQLSVFANTSSKALEKLEEIKYQTRHGTYCRPNDETIKTWFNFWIETYKENTVKKSTIQTYKQAYNEFIGPVLGRVKVHDVNAQMIQRLINSLYKKGYSKSRVNIVYVILEGMLKQAQRNGVILTDPMDAVTFPKFKKQRQEDKRVMTLEEQQKFLEAAAGSKYYDFYLMALTTGMRINEILALKWDDIDFKSKQIHVNGTLFYNRGGAGRSIEPPKTETSRRTIPLLEITETMLHNRKKEQLQNKMALGPAWKEEPQLKGMVFTYPEGGVFWDTGIRVDMKNIVEELQKKQEFEPITPHTFRHTFATRCIENGMPLQVLKTILGHSSLAMTADLYSHVLPDTKAEEMEKIANIF